MSIRRFAVFVSSVQKEFEEESRAINLPIVPSTTDGEET